MSLGLWCWAVAGGWEPCVLGEEHKGRNSQPIFSAVMLKGGVWLQVHWLTSTRPQATTSHSQERMVGTATPSPTSCSQASSRTLDSHRETCTSMTLWYFCSCCSLHRGPLSVCLLFWLCVCVYVCGGAALCACLWMCVCVLVYTGAIWINLVMDFKYSLVYWKRTGLLLQVCLWCGSWSVCLCMCVCVRLGGERGDGGGTAKVQIMLRETDWKRGSLFHIFACDA